MSRAIAHGAVLQIALREWFGLAPCEASALSELFRAWSPIVLTSVPPGSRRAVVYAIRRAMDAEAIDTTAAGYRLTEVGRAECERALAEFRRMALEAA